MNTASDRLYVRIDPQLKHALVEHAKRQDRPVSRVVMQALREYLEREKEREKPN